MINYKPGKLRTAFLSIAPDEIYKTQTTNNSEHSSIQEMQRCIFKYDYFIDSIGEYIKHDGYENVTDAKHKNIS